MARQVEDRVVQMQFDNAKFEQNVKTSISTLDKLKNALNLGKSSASIDGFTATTTKASSGTLAFANAMEVMRRKMPFTEILRITALMKAFNVSINAVTKSIRALTIDQITSGMSKYEEKTASVQTLVNSTGKSVDDINGYLKQLMWFSDETSYSFTNMTSALSQMTSSGGDIEKLVPMITGIANATAYAGKGATEFSRAIYNLGQSYSQGYLALIDWKSVQNAGINSKQLVEELIKAGEELGKIQKGTVTLGTFTDSLKDKWADTEVMEKAFGKFSELSQAAYKAVSAGEYSTAAEAIEALSGNFDTLAQRAFKSAQEAKSFTEAMNATKDAVSSGWMTTFEIIFGTYDEAKKLWTSLATTLWDVFASGAESRNNLLKGALSSGWKQFLDEGIMRSSDYQTFLKTFAVESGVYESIDAIDKMIEAQGGFEESLKSGWLSMEVMDQATRSYASTLSSLTEEELRAKGYTLTEVTAMEELVSKLDSGTISLQEFNESFQQMSGREKIIAGIANVFKYIGELLSPIKIAFQQVFSPVTSGQVASLIDCFYEWSESLKVSSETIESLTNIFKGLFTIIKIIITIIGAFVKGLFTVASALSPIANAVISLGGAVGGLIGKFTQASTVGEAFAIVFQTVADVLGYVASGVAKVINIVAGGIGKLGGLFSILEKIFSFFTQMFNVIKTEVGKSLEGTDLSNLFNLNGLLTGGLILAVIKLIKWLSTVIKDATGTIQKVGATFQKVGATFGALTNILNEFTALVKAKTLKEIAIAVALLAGSLFLLSTVKLENLKVGLLGLGSMLMILSISMKSFQKISDSVSGLGLVKLASTLILLGTAILLFASAVKSLAALDMQQLLTGLVGLAGILTALAVFVPKLAAIGPGLKKSTAGLIGFAIAIAILTKSVVALSSLGIGQLITGLVGVAALLASIGIFIKVLDGAKLKISVGLIAFATGILIMAQAVKSLGGLDLASLAKGLGGIAVILASLAVFTKVTSDSKKMISIGLGLLILSAGIKVFATAVDLLGNMPLDSLVKGLIAVGLSLGALVLAINLMPKSPLLLLTAVAITQIAIAISILSGALKLMGDMSLEGLIQSIGGLAAVLTVLTVAANLMNGAIPGAIAITLISAALTLLTVPLLILSQIPFTGFLTAMLGFAMTLLTFAGLATLLSPLVPVMAALAAVIALFGVGLLAFGGGVALLGAGMLSLVAAVTAGGAALIAFVKECLELIPSFIRKLATGVLDNAPIIFEVIGMLITMVLDLLIENIPKIVQAAITLVDALLNSLKDNVGKIIAVVFDIIGEILSAIAENIVRFVNMGIEIVISFIEGMTSALVNNRDRFADAVGEFLWVFVETAVTTLPKVVGKFVQCGIDAVGGFIQGIGSAIGNAVNGIKEFGSSVINGFKGILGINSPSKVFKDFGKNTVDGYEEGIDKNKNGVKKTMSSFATGLIDSFKKILGINSPSKVMGELGKYTTEGFANGVLDTKQQGFDALKNFGEYSLQGLDGAEDAAYMKGQNIGGSLLSGFALGITAASNKLDEITKPIFRDDYLSSKYGKAGFDVRTIDGDSTTSKKTSATNSTIRKNLLADINKADAKKEGATAGDGFASGFNSSVSSNTKKAFQLYQADAWTQFIKEVGLNMGEITKEFAQKGTTSAASIAKIGKVAGYSAEELKTYISAAKEFNDITDEEQFIMWSNLVARTKEGTEENFTAQQEYFKMLNILEGKHYQHSMDWIEKKKTANELSLKEELAAYQRVQARYAEGTEVYLEMQQKILDMENQIARARYQNSRNWIDNQSSLITKLFGEQRVLQRTDLTDEERKTGLANVKSLQQQIYKETKKYYDDRESLVAEYEKNKKDMELEGVQAEEDMLEAAKNKVAEETQIYEDALKARANALYSAFGMFDRAGDIADIDGEYLISNLQTQLDAIGSYNLDLTSLTARVNDEDFIKEIQDMGINAAAEVKSLNKMTDEELSKYVDLWKQKHDMVNSQAEFDLRDARDSMNKEISRINFEANQLITGPDGIRDTYAKELAQLKTDHEKDLQDLRKTWMVNMGLMNEEVDDNVSTMVNNIINQYGEVYKWSEESGHLLEKTTTDIINTIDTFSKAYDTINQKLQESILQTQGFTKTSGFWTTGLVTSIVNGTPKVISAARNMVNQTLEAVKNASDTHSPSRAFMEIAGYWIQGLVNGVSTSAPLIFNSMREMVSTVLDNVSGLDEMALYPVIRPIVEDTMEPIIDTNPVITPTYDLQALGVPDLNQLMMFNRLLPVNPQLAGISSNTQQLQNLQGTTNVTSDQIVNSVLSLKGDISILAAAMRNLQIVLDTGELVGGITADVDSSLGKLAFYNERGM